MQPLTLIGDGIENPGNARAMLDAAAMFGADCIFRDPAGMRARPAEGCVEPHTALAPAGGALEAFSPLVVLDNIPGAASVYGYRLPPGPHPALVAGNERRGVSTSARSHSHAAVEIPLTSHRLNTLNVAAASAVALYYLSRGGGGRQRVSVHPAARRPDLLLCAPANHVELGSAIRSAGAFGWQRLLIEDSHCVWFGADRAVIAEGRAAARRARNPIRLIPTTPADRFAYRHVTVVSAGRTGAPLHAANLGRGPGQLIVIPDEPALDGDACHWDRLGSRVEFAHLELPPSAPTHRYRLIATIVLAEVARQVGRSAPGARAVRRRHAPFYDRALAATAAERGETVSLDDLQRDY